MKNRPWKSDEIPENCRIRGKKWDKHSWRVIIGANETGEILISGNTSATAESLLKDYVQFPSGEICGVKND